MAGELLPVQPFDRLQKQESHTLHSREIPPPSQHAIIGEKVKADKEAAADSEKTPYKQARAATLPSSAAALFDSTYMSPLLQ
ncbi:hypothetical protein [Desmospora activa]|uniref:Uncharacterized protein n=1 Tax=Desmospora activa DSM 45169 TaxID=1121389 RepID=A0A2T4ZCW9_9BACL|nr:hypothetical protein [Desmospora activa]PTM59729.1 hypothetical protein C8J48_2359 [Desmospora activa DSM 45169]